MDNITFDALRLIVRAPVYAHCGWSVHSNYLTGGGFVVKNLDEWNVSITSLDLSNFYTEMSCNDCLRWIARNWVA